jgi:transcriptional regulator with XRE-family HTH domain
MNFGERVRLLRIQRSLTQAMLAERLDVSMSYISKVERGRLHFGDYPSEKFIHKLAGELNADEDELLMLADKVPASIRERIRERPEVFRIIAQMNDKQIDKLMSDLPKPSNRI